MKAIALLSILAAGTAMAGDKTPYVEPIPMAPIAPPSLYQWFAGASGGYLVENEEDMYTVHFGRELSSQMPDWNSSIFLEVGYTEWDDYDNYDYYYSEGFRESVDVELEIIPVTLNYKLERQFSNSLRVYIGVGAGAAFIDAKGSYRYGEGTSSDSDDDVVFFAQAFTGVLYNVNPAFELFAGLRVIYFDDPDFDFESDDVHIDSYDNFGLDFDESDVLVELGARFNF